MTSAPLSGSVLLARAAVAITASCLLAACGGSAQPAAAPPPAAAPAPAGPTQINGSGKLAPPDQAKGAFTYNTALAPVGAQLAVQASTSGNNTTVTLEASGLAPNRGYAAHVHAKPCGPTGAAAGPHQQHQPDPAAKPDKPSTDPAFANPTNEVWLDMRTNADGKATVTSTVPFVFGAQKPGSVILHEAERTATEPGKAGTAGARIACLDVPFSQLGAG